MSITTKTTTINLMETAKAVYSILPSGGKGVQYTVFGKPIPLPRPRGFVTSKGVVKAYSPVKGRGSAFSKQLVMLLGGAKASFPIFQQGDQGLCVTITFRIRRPNNHYKGGNRNLGLILENKMMERVTGGDIDNLSKFPLDAMNKVVYHDDNMVTTLLVSKIWCEDPDSDGSTTIKVKNL
jgi:Holliday junction resolvase RusA-like endonuclease